MSTMLTRRDPLLADFDAMTENLERMFGLRAAPGGNRGFLPPVDIWEDEQQVVIQLDIPAASSTTSPPRRSTASSSYPASGRAATAPSGATAASAGRAGSCGHSPSRRASTAA